MGNGPSKAELEKIKIESEAKYKPVEIEWAARKEIALVQVKLDDKRADLDYRYKMEKLTNDKIKNTLHVQTQSEVIIKITERGFSPDNFCMATGISYLTLKDELPKEEMEILKTTMLESMDRNTKRKTRGVDECDTGFESDSDTADNQIMTT